MNDGGERDQSLEEIRANYEAYEREGRSSLWSLSNPGYRRLAEANEAALTSLLAGSLRPDGVSLLDVGCGGGGLAVLTDKLHLPIRVTGIDLLPDRIEAARLLVPGATFVVGSADAMPFDDESFDLASALTMFSSLPTPTLEEDVAREIRRVLRPGGWLIWFDLRVRNPWNPRVHPVSARRLRTLFPGWLVELHSIGVPPPIARRLGRLTPLAYPALHAIAPIRSHLVGRLQKPA